jgi:hypothetical protein
LIWECDCVLFSFVCVCAYGELEFLNFKLVYLDNVVPRGIT